MTPLQARHNSNGHWLSGNGAYAEFTKSQYSSDPRLRIQDPKCLKQKTMWPNMPVRIRVLSLGQNQNFIVKGELSDANALKVCLCSQNQFPNQQTVYLVEAFDPHTVEVLGSHFQLHPSFFVEHERIKDFDYDAFGQTDTVLLPSSLATRDHVTLKYSEPVYVSQGTSGLRLHCYATGRHIKRTRSGENMLPVGVLRRKCSVWNREVDGASDTIVLCDPKVTLLGTNGDKRPLLVDIYPFQGGYVNFIPEKEQLKAQGGPPRSSILDDLTFYLTNHFSLLTDHSYSKGIQVFINKIIAGHYWELANFTNATLAETQRRLSKHSDLAGFSVRDVERDWSDTQADERRSEQYCRELESVMLQLNIAPRAPTNARIMDWSDYTEDFQFLHTGFKKLRRRAVSLNTAMTTLAGIAGNRQAVIQQKQSLREAKRTKALTFLGLVFIPLAYVCSLFSMQGAFAPGGPLFWVYFLVAIPLVGLVSLGNWILDQGYSYDASDWYAHNLLDRFKNKNKPPV
ncbi:hypothetical protein F4781DRAFT_420579 [Annulohypoxylon bovei var. microspora]|nr:hypothetical protein F4781DRAFT_420579 [Annulohypoxylon bovei var. microspora]